ncbi:MAG: hypothetical protein JNK07_16330 [Alphaproteobacteria bacterium]|nr:hypothetical protein [Alphaproteobacteria bacterium]
MDTLKLSSIVFAAAFSLAACSDRLVEAPPLGGAIAQNAAAQIVDPTPESTETPPPLNGERNNAAQTRYEKGNTIKPKDVKTSDTTSSSGGKP